MSQPASEPSQKKDVSRLSAFLQDCLQAGVLKGFKYFELYLRGREELLVRVINQRNTPTSSLSRQPTSLNLAKSQTKLLLSMKTQRLTNMSSLQYGLPPASPCDRELEMDETKTAFLIAGYARYKSPYVWLRSNHSRLIKLRDNQKLHSDNPVRLESTNYWKDHDVKLWDILTEIVSLSLQPAPANPFAVDHSYYDNLPLEESFVVVGGMVNFLQKVFLRGYPFDHQVLKDIRILQKRHYSELRELLQPFPDSAKKCD